MSERVEILLAEDDEADVVLLQRAFREAGVTRKLEVARDGQAAIDALSRMSNAEHGCMPSLVVLDLKMPRKNGMEVLQWVRGQPALRCIPIFIFSSSAHREDIERAYVLGANGFIVKPPSTAERTVVARFIGEWLKLNQAPLASTEGFRTAQALHVIRGYDRAPAPM